MTDVHTILQINTRDRRGGAEQVAWNLFQAYQARGRTSWLAVGKKYSNDPNVWEMTNAPYATSRWTRSWLRLSEALSPLRSRNGWKGIAASQAQLYLIAQPAARRQRRQGYEDFTYPGTKQLLAQLPVRPDVVHCHNLHGDYFDLTALPWLSRQRPVLLHLHDTWLLSGHCAQPLDCTRWQRGCGACPYLTIYPALAKDNTAANWQRKQAIYAASRLYVVTVSQWLLDQVQQSMLPSARTRVIHNGIDLTVFKPGEQQAARRALGLPPTARIVLFSVHSAFADLTTLQNALSRVQGEALLFIGIGGQGAATRQWGQGQVIAPGYIRTPTEMANYYRAADLYLQITRADSFPTTVLEALACGTPVVATAIGGIPEQIRHRETGLLIPAQDDTALCTAIQELLQDNEQRTRMGMAAAGDSHRRFGLEHQIDQFLALYEEIAVDWHIAQANVRPTAPRKPQKTGKQ